MELSLSLGFARREKKDEEEEESSIRLSLLPSSRSGPILEASIKDLDVNRPATAEDQAVTRSGNSEEEENGSPRKKLRLSKEQSAFLEESFKEHSTLNPKQKVALAKQLNLRPRQLEVWFQNRRARTKQKQTEVDCEYLKRCCETLTEENRRLHKELAELRALKTPSGPFSSHLSATTLSMCPSCERTTTNTVASARQSSNSTAPFASLAAKPSCFAAPFAAS